MRNKVRKLIFQRPNGLFVLSRELTPLEYDLMVEPMWLRTLNSNGQVPVFIAVATITRMYWHARCVACTAEDPTAVGDRAG